MCKGNGHPLVLGNLPMTLDMNISLTASTPTVSCSSGKGADFKIQFYITTILVKLFKTNEKKEKTKLGGGGTHL